jgi:hypothetical protein
MGIAFGDVLVDALMIETGQPLGLTGRLQSAQWTAANAAMLLTGVVGGYVSAIGRPDGALLFCAALWGVSLLLAYRFAQDAPNAPVARKLAGRCLAHCRPPRDGVRHSVRGSLTRCGPRCCIAQRRLRN